MTTTRDETLSDLLKAFWQARAYLMIGGVIGFIAAALIVIFSVPHMRSIMVVSPTADIHAPLFQQGQDQNSNVKETIPFLRYLKIISGPNVVKAVLNQNPDIKSALQNNRRFTFLPPTTFEHAEEIAAYLTKEIMIKPVGDTPLRVIELEHPNPVLAKKLLLSLHEASDAILRQEMLQKTNARLEYLKSTIAETANPDHRQALTDLLIEQERASMMLKMDRHFAATLVEPPYIYPKPVWPRKSYLFPILVLTGMLAGWIIFGVVKTYDEDEV